MSYIILIGLFQALITALLFFISRKNKPLDWLMLTLLAFVVTHMAIKFSIYALMNNAVLKQSFNTFIVLGYGPVLWMIAQKAEDDRYLPVKDWYVLLPTLLAGIGYLSIASFMIFTGTVPAKAIDWYNTITSVMIVVSCLCFAILTLRISRRFNQYWLTEQKMVRSLSLVFLSMSLVMLLAGMLKFQLVKTDASAILMRVLVYAHLLLISIIILRYRVAAQTELAITVTEELEAEQASGDIPLSAIFIGAEEDIISESFKEPLISGNEGYSGLMEPVAVATVQVKTGISREQQMAIVKKLSGLMQTKKLFRDADLDLKKLSELSGISKHHISEALNQFGQKTFYQFLNEHRIEELLLLLDKCKKNGVRPNILSLAFDVGFNSKSTFNLYFKKSTGLTPSEYLKK